MKKSIFFFFSIRAKRKRKSAVPGNISLEARVINSLLCLKPIQIWISVISNQQKTDNYQSCGPSTPESAISLHLGPPLNSADGPWRAEGGQEGCPGAGHPLRQPARAPWSSWRSSCSRCPRNRLDEPTPMELVSGVGGGPGRTSVGPFPGSGSDCYLCRTWLLLCFPKLFLFGEFRRATGDCSNHACRVCTWKLPHYCET